MGTHVFRIEYEDGVLIVTGPFMPAKSKAGITVWTRMLIRERFPDATDISIDNVEIDGDEARVRARVKLSPSLSQVVVEVKERFNGADASL